MLEIAGMLFCVLVGMLILAIYGMRIEETYNDRKRAHGEEAKARATRKWLFAIFFPVIWPIALVVWAIKYLARVPVAVINLVKEMKIGKL